MNLAEELAAIFISYDYKWKMKDGTTVVPSKEDMERTLDGIAERMSTEPTGAVLSVGRLLANKQEEGLEIYVYIGDYK